MSGSVLLALPEPDSEATEESVYEWLRRMRTAGVGTVGPPGEGPPVAAICAAAVHPLEIAAALEAAGVSHRVALTRHGQPDVFALARRLWVAVPFRPVQTEIAPPQRAGSWQDLGRGALYGAPALTLFALTRTLHLDLGRWVLPLALTWGWALGQLTAFVCYTLRARGDGVGELVAGARLLAASVITTALIALGVERISGGGRVSVLTAAAVTTYMVASTILGLHEQERLAALILVPSAAASVFALLTRGTEVTDAVMTLFIIGSAAATVLAAVARLALRTEGRLNVGAADVRVGAGHLVHGIACGAALSLVAIEGARVHPSTGHPALVALPLLATLGVMEWQLRTFKSGIDHLMQRSQHVATFKPRARQILRRSLAIYLLSATVATAAVAAIIDFSGDRPPWTLLGAQVLLGLAFFLDLTLTSIGRLDRVLLCWLVGLVVACACAAFAAARTSTPPDLVAWRASSAGLIAVFLLLRSDAERIATSAISH